MKINKYIVGFLLLGVLLIYGCTKDIWEGKDGVPKNPNLPYVISFVDSTSDSTITVTVAVRNNYKSILKQGICWSTSSNPTIGNGNVIYGPLIDTVLVYDTVAGILTPKDSTFSATTFSITIKGLSPKTTYYIEAFANNAIDSSGLSYDPHQLTITTLPASPYRFGQYYAGGYVFYIDTTTGLHGLVCDTTDLMDTTSPTIPWSIVNNYPSSAIVSNTDIGAGYSNTDTILKYFDSLPNSASICKAYNGGGYTDWYMPSKDELNMMFLNLAARGYGNFSLTNYWSSSDLVFDTKSYAWAQYFVDGNQYYFDKSLPLHVRAVRKF